MSDVLTYAGQFGIAGCFPRGHVATTRVLEARMRVVARKDLSCIFMSFDGEGSVREVKDNDEKNNRLRDIGSGN